MYDLHSHLLPSIPGDDGASSYDMAYRMARQSVESGFHHVIATSHFIPGQPYGKREDLQAAAKTISKFLRSKDLFLEIIPAHEVYLTPELICHLKSKEVILIAGRFLLLELPMTGWMMETFSLLEAIGKMGIIPIVAHPERCGAIAKDPSLAVELIETGAYLQLNLGSLRHPSSSAGSAAKKLLQHRMYHFVGSDAHSDLKRSPRVSDALETLKILTDGQPGYFKDLVLHNPERLLKGLHVDNDYDEGWNSLELNQAPMKMPFKQLFWKTLEAWRFAKR